jgi:hypothetical protein
MNEESPIPKTSYMAVASLILALLWYVGWTLTLVFAILGLKDPQGWNWLPYVVWGMWGLPVASLAVVLGTWALWRIRIRPEQLTGNWFAISALTLCLLACPAWYIAPFFVNLWR